VDDRIKGLRAGGDDYLPKPYSFAELLARVEVLSRRHGGPAEENRLSCRRPRARSSFRTGWRVARTN